MKEIIFACVLSIVIIAMQVFLSSKRNRWIGLIFPVASILFAITTSFKAPRVAMTINLLIFYFIPASILTAIYLLCRQNINNKQLDTDDLDNSK